MTMDGLITRDEIIRQLEEIGEEEVAYRVALGVYGEEGNERRGVAAEWLRQKQQLRLEASMHEQARIGKSARLAAWIAAATGVGGVLIAVSQTGWLGWLVSVVRTLGN